MTYRVRWGYMERSECCLNTFPEALAFARRKRAANAKETYKSVSIYNDDKADQDSYGLTAQEQEEWQQ